MKTLITVLVFIFSLQVSGQTIEKEKQYIDSKTTVKNVKIGSKWDEIYRNTIYKRIALKEDSVILTTSVNKRKEIVDAWLKKSYKNGDTTFVYKAGKQDFRKVFYFDGTWTYEQRIDIWQLKTQPVNKKIIIEDYFKRAKKLNFTDAVYIETLRYIKFGEIPVTKDSIVDIKIRR